MPLDVPPAKCPMCGSAIMRVMSEKLFMGEVFACLKCIAVIKNHGLEEERKEGLCR